VRAYEFIDILAVHEVAHLTACLKHTHWLESQSVPESNASVLSSTPGSQKSVLVWGPGDSFDCSDMVAEPCLRKLIVVDTPHEEFVVITT